MNLGDIVALAKAGYSVKDVKELIEMANASSVSSPQTEDKPADTPQPAGETSSITETSSDTKNENQDNKEDTSNGDVDKYKQEIADLKEKLSKAQKAAAHTDMADTEDNRSVGDVLGDLAKSFM